MLSNHQLISAKISGGLVGHQVASLSHSTLLSSKVEFVASGNNDQSMCVNNLKSKYHQFKGGNNANNNNQSEVNENSKSPQMNGQIKFHKHQKVSPQNGSSSKEDVNKNVVMDSGGIPTPRVELFNPAKVQLEWRQIRKIGAGLINMGNTCFMNTVIQCLTYCTPLSNYLLYDEDHSYKCKLAGFCMICELQKHMKRALERHGQAIKPMYIYQKLKSIAKHFQFGRQEDAHEFLRYVVDNLWKASLANHEGSSKLDPTSKETTVVNHIFGGYNRSQVVCCNCHGRSNTFDHFMDFILDIKSVSTLEGALKKFIEPEMLEDDNAYKCPKCGTKVRAEKKFTVHKPPNVATFQLKRFDYNRMFGGKITKPVSYPEKLDLRPYMSDPKGPPVQYKLNSVLVHMGHTCNSGHYFCYVRNSNGLWYLMDDTRVHQVSQNQVLAQQAYVLFYVRVAAPKQIIKKMSSASPSSTTSSTPPHSKLVKNGVSHRPNISTPLCNGISKLAVNKNPTNSPRPIYANSVINREKISFDIKRPVSTPSTLNNTTAPSTLVTPIKCNLNGTKRKEPSLVPYDVKDSSSSESEPEQPKLMNGHATKLTDIPLPGELSPTKQVKGHFDLPLKPDRLSPRMNLPLRISDVSAASRAKSTNSWHVMDDRLQSPSVASGSSNNSVNSTTDWTVTDSVELAVSPRLRNKHLGWSVKPKNVNGVAVAPPSVVSKETQQLSPDSLLGRGEPNRCERQIIACKSPIRTNVCGGTTTTPQWIKGVLEPPDCSSDGGHDTNLDYRKRKFESVDGGQKGDCPLLKKCKETDETTGGIKMADSSVCVVSENEAAISVAPPVVFKKNKNKNRSERKRRKSGDSDGSYECEWIERTKETLEAEKSNSGSDKLKNGWSHGKCVDNTVNELLQMSGKGYGKGVSTWEDGQKSQVNAPDDDYSFRKYNNDDEYDQEFDSGKLKKLKKRYSEGDFAINKNPFQHFQDSKRKNDNSWKRNSLGNGNNNYKNRDWQQNNSYRGNNNNFNRGNSDRNYNNFKHNNNKSGGRGGGGYYGNSRNNNKPNTHHRFEKY